MNELEKVKDLLDQAYTYADEASTLLYNTTEMDHLTDPVDTVLTFLEEAIYTLRKELTAEQES